MPMIVKTVSVSGFREARVVESIAVGDFEIAQDERGNLIVAPIPTGAEVVMRAMYLMPGGIRRRSVLLMAVTGQPSGAPQ